MRALIIVLAGHIFATHTKLLYYLNPEVVDKHPFSFTVLDEPTFLSMFFALSYSLATAFVIYKVNTRWIVMTYAILDGLSVLLYYFTEIPVWLSGFYFAGYTSFLIASVFIIRQQRTTTLMDTWKSIKKES